MLALKSALIVYRLSVQSHSSNVTWWLPDAGSGLKLAMASWAAASEVLGRPEAVH